MKSDLGFTRDLAGKEHFYPQDSLPRRRFGHPMKTKSSAILAGAILLLMVTPSPATNPSMALVTHPVYLGEQADPVSIPMSAVPVWHNYGYGIHSVISHPRIFPAGPLVSERGLEFNMNLASVYDIAVEPEDSTQVPQFPVVLRVGSRKPPAEARHTREQALEATLWSLILNTPGSEKTPLVVKIESGDPAHAKYAGNYVLAPDGLSLVVGEIANSKLVRDDRGVVSVAFGPPAKPAPAAPQVAFVPLLRGGGAEGDEQIALVPHWTRSDAAPMELLWTSIPLGMNVFSSKRGANANPLHTGPFDSQNLAKDLETLFVYSSGSERELPKDELDRLFATFCYAAVLTAAATEEKPLAISFDGYPADAWDHLGEDGWKSTKQPGGGKRWARSFTSPPATLLGQRLVPRETGGWWVEPAEPALPDLSAPASPDQSEPESAE